MPLGHLAGRAAAALASGIAGAIVVDRVKSGSGRRPLRGAAVAVTTWGIRARRSAETGAENVRLATGDIVAEARERVGEQAPPPTVGGTHGDHEH
ncbi:DUF1490 family protein [Nakamurella flavida]|uniref:DUF1490 family protein n=1 Tax=Nakamurella flavida TaxID=363630 RepID=A0A938YL35_9ACTN|nr:DUF1490 family protein [Nakamurella flavida]MBM9477982.1 DUF1490 family protein [Nakamurella flavida]MDP9778302.1 hypothetical protein [Nakamurella flavida]